MVNNVHFISAVPSIEGFEETEIWTRRQQKRKSLLKKKKSPSHTNEKILPGWQSASPTAETVSSQPQMSINTIDVLSEEKALSVSWHLDLGGSQIHNKME